MTDEPPPPWIALPDMAPEEPATHGEAEMYVTLTWHPFWRGLSPEAKAAYLDRWQATPRWREAIATLYDGEGIDWAAEAREAEEWRGAHLDRQPKRPWWRRLR